jgi:lysozyme
VTYSRACLDLVAEFEGCKLAAYQDVGGVWTIGFGRTVGVRPGMRIDQAQADELLCEDLEATARAVSGAVHVPLTQGQFDALVSFAFNCKGWRGSTLLRLVNEGQFTAAAAEFPRWDHAGKAEFAGLLRRRMAEQALFVG